MTKWRLYAWGANSHGQLGLEFQSEQCPLPREVVLESRGVEISDIKKINGGAGHTLLLDKKGRVFCCGLNDKGQAGLGPDSEKFVLKFARITRLRERIKDIACGWNSSLALTESGDIYSWGSNAYGQLGIQNGGQSVYENPEKITNLNEKITAVSMGLRHSAIVTESGKVLVTGAGNKGQLGIGEKSNKAIFTHVAALEDVREIVCGQNHTGALTKSGKIYTWGDNKYGQLGIDCITKTIDYPTEIKIENTGQCSELRAGWTHTSVFNDAKKIVTWGRNNYGQLGFQENQTNPTWAGKAMNFFQKFVQLSIGSEHNVAIAEDLSIYSWGWNEHGNCGDGSTRDIFQPKKVPLPRDGQAFLVGTGAGHSFAVVADKF